MAEHFEPGTAVQSKTEVELTLSCRSLKGKDLLSKSDPMCVTFIQPFGETRWVEYHRTEQIKNSHDPNFQAKVLIPYRFEEQQTLKFEIYDIDSKAAKLESHDFIGFAICNLGQIISSGKVQLPLMLRPKNKKKGSLSSDDEKSKKSTKEAKSKKSPKKEKIESHMIISAEELSTLKDEVILQFSGHKLDKKDMFGKSDPFLVFHKATDSGDYSIVHKTEMVKNNLNPTWLKFTIPVRTLCNGDYDRKLKVICYDWNSNGKDTLIGEFYTTLKQLSEGPSDKNVFKGINPKMKEKKNYTQSGEFRLTYYQLQKVNTFIDYVKGGTQLHCSIAIDFTGSNGNPAMPESLHFISNVPNSYEQAILSVGGIIQDYDTDKLFPVLGFGARLPPDGRVSHEFFVNMNPTYPYCNGITGIVEAYRNCIHQIQLHGPTNFAPVINHVARFATAHQDGSCYFVLLILTDGVITDMPNTIQAIVEASKLPMSIIIVGIGNADFSAMEKLDADTVGLSVGGVKAIRDIVQFVPFNKFAHVGDQRTARLNLAREVLEEIPNQFIGYMKAKNFMPKPAQVETTVLDADPELLLTA